MAFAKDEKASDESERLVLDEQDTDDDDDDDDDDEATVDVVDR